MPARVVKAKYASTCATCHKRIDVNDQCYFDPNAPAGKRMWHYNCAAPTMPQQSGNLPTGPHQNLDAEAILDSLNGDASTASSDAAAAAAQASAASAAEAAASASFYNGSSISWHSRGRSAYGSASNDPDPNDPFVRHSELDATMSDFARQITNQLTRRDRAFNDHRHAITELIKVIRLEFDEQLSKVQQNAPTVARSVTIKVNDLPAVDAGLQHRNFPQLVRASQARLPDGARLNIWLSGPAGSGKSTACKKLAELLDLPFYLVGAIDDASKLVGFTDAQGRTVVRPFREAFTKPSVFLWDEIDRSYPGAVMPFNSALANGMLDFPDAIINRHPDALILATANTTGLGSDMRYVSAMRQDAAFLDRFVTLDWPIDEDLELATAPDTEWCRYVQRIRRTVASQGLDDITISPRATYAGAALLAAGFTRDQVASMVIRRGLTEDTWRKINV